MKFHLLYSTPSCYLKAVHDDAAKKNIKWATKEDDFFPYASDPNAFWTGYFTSKPTIKRYERTGNNFLQICKQLYALTDLGPEDWTDLNTLREAMGVMQHHDAITGTEKDHVAHDYSRMLSKGIDECNFIAATALSKTVTGSKSEDNKPTIQFDSCHLSNVSQCEFTENKESFIVTVYNPLSRIVNHHVRLPVAGSVYAVNDSNGISLPIQIIPIHDAISRIPGRISNTKYELVFEAKDLPPMGFKSYYVKNYKNAKSDIKTSNLEDFNNENIQIKIDEDTGLIYELTINGKVLPIKQEFAFYRGTVGDNEEFKNRSSGAYIFRPNGTAAYQIAQKASYKLYNGDVVSELQQTFNEWVSQTIRIYHSENYVEFDWIIGPLPKDDINGKEILSQYTTNLQTEATFYTDSNGREMLKRVRNFRPTWKLDLHEPVAGNYYPVTSKILIRDPNQDVEVAVLTDRAQGGTSLVDGQIELMIHRNSLHDDAFGVGEPLDEQAFGKGLVVRGSHYLVAGPYISKEGLAAQERTLAQQKLLSAWTFISPTNNLDFSEWKNKYKMEFTGLQNALPDNVQILTLEPWEGMSFLIRFEHIFENKEDSNLSKQVVINLKNVFAPFAVISYKETTLGGNQWLSENNRLQFAAGKKLEDLVDFYDSYLPRSDKMEADWLKGKKSWSRSQLESNEIRERISRVEPRYEAADSDFEIVLQPMQIRTFVIEIQENK